MPKVPLFEFMRTVSQKDWLHLRIKLSMGVRFLLMFEKNPAKALIPLILVTEAMSEVRFGESLSPPPQLVEVQVHKETW